MTAPDRTFTHHARTLLVLGLPLIGSNIAQFAMHLTDALMLGWYDVAALAAATLATSVWFVAFILGAGFAWAVMPVAAQAVESDDKVQVRRATRMGLWLSVIYAALLVPPLFFSRPLLLSMGQEPAVAALAQAYLRIDGFGLIPALSILVLRSFFSALERTGVILWVTVASALLNVPLNWVLIFGNLGAPELGVQGAAASSLTLHVLGLLTLILYARARFAEYDLFTRLWKPDLQIMGRIFRLGVPIGLTSVAEGGLFSASTIMMGWVGTIELAAHGIALQITSGIFVIHMGLSQAATVRAGRAFGRRDEDSLRRGGAVALALSLAVACATVALFLALPAPLVGAFVDPGDPARDAIIAAGVTFLALGAVFQLVDAAQVMTLGLLRGVQDTAVPMLMAGISYWVVGMPIAYVTAFLLDVGAAGIWLGLVGGLGLAALLLSVRFWRRAVRIGAALQV